MKEITFTKFMINVSAIALPVALILNILPDPIAGMILNTAGVILCGAFVLAIPVLFVFNLIKYLSQ